MSAEVRRLLRQVWAQGGNLTVVGDCLRVRAPFPLPEDLMDRLRAHKTEIIAHLHNIERPARIVYRFRTSPSDERQYMITPSNLAADEARAHCGAIFGQIYEFERDHHRAPAAIGSRGPNACGAG